MLVLTLVLTLVVGVVVVVVVVVVGSVVVVVVGAVVVGVIVTVSVAGAVVGAGATADLDVVVSGVNEVVWVGASPPVRTLARPYTMRAIRTAPSAPNATSAAGLRYQGTGSPGGGPI